MTATIVICVLLAAIITAIIISLIRNRRKGRSSCGCNCSSCPLSGKCHQQK